jgi:hypothetical protein
MFMQGKVIGVVSGTEGSKLFGYPSDGPIETKVATLKLNKNLADQFLLLKGTP